MTLIELRQTLAALKQSTEAKDFETYYGADAANDVIAFVNTVSALLTPDQNGTLPVLDVKAQQSIFAAAGMLQNAIAPDQTNVEFDREHPDVFVADRNRMAEIVTLFASLDANKNQTVEQAITANERISATVTGDVGKMGGNANSRKLINIPTGNGESVNGFFTAGDKRINLDPDDIKRRMLTEAAKKNRNDPVYQDFISRLLNPAKVFGPGVLNGLASTDNNNQLYPASTDRQFAAECFNWEHLIKDGYFTVDSINKALDNQNVRELIADLYMTVDPAKVQERGTMFLQYGVEGTGIKAEKDASVPMRNVAMTRVATLLGKSHLLARSIPITVEQDGIQTTGVFMEQAKGDTFPPDLKNGDIDEDAVKKSKFGHMPKDCIAPSALKDMADVEIIDFICGNVDRHQANLTYIFDNNNRVIGVQGIDNDLSFGTARLAPDKSLQNGTPLHSINVISADMAETIRDLSPELLKIVLADTGLKQAEIDASVERLEQLQTYLSKSIEREFRNEVPDNAADAVLMSYLHVMKDDSEWNGVTLGQLTMNSDTSSNIFLNGLSVRGLRRYSDPHVAIEDQKPTFAKADSVDDLSPEKLDAMDALLSDLYKDMKKSVSLFHPCKSDFRDVLDTTKKLLDFRKPDANGTVPDVVNNPAACNAYIQLLDTLAKQTEIYRNRKTFEVTTRADTSATGKNRCDLADKLEKAVKGRLTAFKDAALDRDERMLDEAYNETAEARKMEAKLTIVSDALVNQIMENGSTMEREKVAVVVQRGVTLDTMVRDGAALDTLVTLAKENPQELFRQYVETNRTIQENKNSAAAKEAAEEQLAHTAPDKQAEQKTEIQPVSSRK